MAYAALLPRKHTVPPAAMSLSVIGLSLLEVQVVPPLVLYSIVSANGLSTVMVVPSSNASKVSGVEVMSCALAPATNSRNASKVSKVFFIVLCVYLLIDNCQGNSPVFHRQGIIFQYFRHGITHLKSGAKIRKKTPLHSVFAEKFQSSKKTPLFPPPSYRENRIRAPLRHCPKRRGWGNCHW